MAATLQAPRRPLVRRLLLWSALLALTYVGAAVLLWIFQERIIFKQRPLSPQQADEVRATYREMRSIRLVGADGVPIHAWYLPASAQASPRRLVLYFGANNEQVHWQLAARPAFDGWDRLLVDYRGYGLSDGSPSQAALEADASRWLALARSGGDGVAKAERLVVMGTGMGSYVATYLAAKHAVDGVILVVPYDSAVGIAQEMLPLYPVHWIMRHRFKTIAEAPKVRAPTLFIVGLQDTFVKERPRRVYQAWGSPARQWVELSRANHQTAPADPLYWHHLGEFLRGL